MSFREVGVLEVKEVLRLWLRGEGLRAIGRVLGVDRKTVRRYVEGARDVGIYREGGEGQLTERLLGLVVQGVRPGVPGVHGDVWKLCEENREVLGGWLEKRLRLTKAQELLRRQTGQAVAYRTLHRFAVERLGFGKRRVTVWKASLTPCDGPAVASHTDPQSQPKGRSRVLGPRYLSLESEP